jgi:hypothetical protein
VPFGVGAIDGEAARSLRVLESGPDASALDATERSATDTNAGVVTTGTGAEPGSAPTAIESNGSNGYGPGEEPRPREGEPTASAHGELL